jgi:hypothetical protein
VAFRSDYRKFPSALYRRIHAAIRDLPFDIYKGMAAGLAGAGAVAAFLLLQAETGLLPRFDLIGALGELTFTGRTGGWIVHFLVGALWGGLFAWLDPDLPGDSLAQRGVAFGIGAWFLTMILLMPLAGYGFFALEIGILATLFALLLHVAFGYATGRIYALLILQAVPLRFRSLRRR